jgi:hypothetical protein
MRRAFQPRRNELPELDADGRAFRNALNQGSGDYYDFKVGTAFIDL